MRNSFKKTYFYSTIKNKLFLESLPIFFSAVVSGGISTFTNFLLAKIFTPTDFAIFRTITAAFGFLVVFLDFGTNITLIRYIAIYNSKNQKGKIKKLIIKIIKLKLLILLLVSIFVFIFKDQLAGSFLHNPSIGYLALLGLVFFAFHYFDINKAILTGFKKFNLLSIYNILLPVYGLGFSVVFAIYFKVEGAIIAYAIAYFLAILFVIWFLTRKNILRSTKSEINYSRIIKTFSLPAYFANFPQAMTLITIPTIALFFPPQIVGLFAFSLIFYNAFTLIPQSVYYVLLPQMSALFSKDELIKIGQLLKSAIFLYLIVSIPTILVSLFVVRFVLRLFLPEYLASLPAINIMAVFSILAGLSIIYNAALNAQAKLKQAAILSYLTAIVLITISFLAATSIN